MEEIRAENFVFELLSEIEQMEDKQVDYKQEVKEIGEMFIDRLQPSGGEGI